MFSTQQTIYDSLKNAGWTRDEGRTGGIKRQTGDVGIEIETESKSAYNVPELKFWSSHTDGSLRDFGIEYVLRGAIGRGKECREALVEWNDKVNKKFKLIPDSYSTSVHVHLNFLNNTWIELANFFCTYYLVENLLQRLAGPDRLSNMFAMPLCDAEGELTGITSLVQNIGNLKHKNINLPIDQYKYAALNLCNLTKLGTMEIRTLRGTTDIDTIEEWVDVLLAIKDFACQDGLTPSAIVDMADKQGAEIIYPIFGKHVGLVSKLKDIDKLIKQNLYFVAKIASSSRFIDKTWGFPKPKRIYKEKFTESLDKIAMDMFAEPFAKLAVQHRIVVEETLTRQLQTDVRNVTFENGEDF